MEDPVKMNYLTIEKNEYRISSGSDISPGPSPPGSPKTQTKTRGGWAKIKRELITSKGERSKDKEKFDEFSPSSTPEMRPVNTLPKSPHLQSKRNPDQYFDQNNNGSTFTGYNQTGVLSQNNNHLNTSYLMAPGGMDKRKCVKLLMLGQDGVGKSAFVVRYLTRRYIGEYDPKIEGIFRKTVNMNNQDINVEIKDTSRGINWSGRANDLIWTNGLICVYSINNRSSFNEIQSISKMLLQQKKSRGIPCLLIGNKKDLEKNERRVQASEGQQLADSINGTFCELSVSDGYIELENIVNKFIKDKCSDLKNHLLPQSKILSSKSTPEIRKPLGGGQGGSNDGGGVDIEVKTEKKTRALWQKLLTNNNKKQ